MSIARRTEKDAKVRKDLNNIPACGARAINFYRHSGPSGPEEDPAAASRVLRRAQTALILFILFILFILLQTRERLRASRPLKHCETRCSIDMKVLTDLSGRRDCEGQALALRGPGRFFS